MTCQVEREREAPYLKPFAAQCTLLHCWVTICCRLFDACLRSKYHINWLPSIFHTLKAGRSHGHSVGWSSLRTQWSATSNLHSKRMESILSDIQALSILIRSSRCTREVWSDLVQLRMSRGVEAPEHSGWQDFQRRPIWPGCPVGVRAGSGPKMRWAWSAVCHLATTGVSGPDHSIMNVVRQAAVR